MQGDKMSEFLGNLIGCIVMLLIPVAILLFVKWLNGDYENSENKDVEKEQSESPKIKTPKPNKFNTPKFNLPKFEDSGWGLFYVICGWIGLVAMIVFFVQKESTFAFVMLGCSLSCFFAAHVLRFQEKIAFHAEQQTELLEKIYSKKTTNH